MSGSSSMVLERIFRQSERTWGSWRSFLRSTSVRREGGEGLMNCLVCGHEVVELVGRAVELGMDPSIKVYNCPGCQDMYIEDPPGVLRPIAFGPIKR